LDFIIFFCFKTKIKNSYLKKYSLQKSYKAIDISLIKSWSKQILETLNFIYSKGFFYGHLHSGNILIVEQNRIKLTDLHNSLLGLPYIYRSFLLQHRKIQVNYLVCLIF
jgi:PX domain-containing protein kinase-like protein